MADTWDMFDMGVQTLFLIGLGVVELLVVPGFGRIVSCTARIIFHVGSTEVSQARYTCCCSRGGRDLLG